ncbi:MAG: hypothetical protein BroJett011_76080 [Chloroflexota bacterium]|nr:MAG: hypothetical protein BroJett011_76080 [Chloroflexota bacterium]
MATMLTASSVIKIVDGGETVVDREFIYEYEITGKVEGDYWLDVAASSFTLCVKGTNIATPAIVDPFVVGLSTIRGIAIKSEINLELSVDGAVAPIKMAEGNFMMAQAEMQTIKIAKDDTRSGSVSFIVWGDR